MNTTRKSLRLRAGIVGGCCAALLAGGAGAAIAAPSAAPQAAPAAATASITAHVTPSTVKAGQRVTLSGNAHGIKVGSILTVDHLNSSGKWAALDHVQTKVVQPDIYKVHVKLSDKGKQELRVVHNTTMSPIVHVTVT